MPTPSDVKAFYDEFASSTLLKDFFRVNPRQEAIKALCREFVPQGARVLEIGCGVGIVARYLRERASYVLGVDISDNNVRIARAYAGGGNAEFKVLDVIEEAGRLEEHGKFDVILLPDVIEHIPKKRHRDLFETIEGHLTATGRVLLTYPSPEYQEYLKARHPEWLQVIDETIYMDDIVNVTSLKPLSFRYVDIWHRHQYVHFVLTRERDFGEEPLKRSAFEALTYRVRKYRWRLSNFLFLRRIRQRTK